MLDYFMKPWMKVFGLVPYVMYAVDPPSSTTTHYGLAKYNDGDNPGSARLNQDKDTIDTEIYSSSISNRTYTLPLLLSASNIEIGYNDNLILDGNNLDTAQNIRTTDAPSFEGINVWEPSIGKQFYMPKGVSIAYLNAFYTLMSGSAILIGTDSIVGQNLDPMLNVIGDVKLGTFVGAFKVPSTHQITGSTYITGSVFSQEGAMWTRGNTIWGKLLARGETYVSGNSYFGEKILSNGPLYLAPGIVSASNPEPDNTASWEDTFQESQDRADTEQIALDGNVIPDPDPDNDLMLYVSGNSFFKGQVEIQGGFTSSNGAFSYNADTGQMIVTSVLISGSEEISVDTDTGALILGSTQTTSSISNLVVSSIVYSGSGNPSQDEASERQLVLHSGKDGLIAWKSGSATTSSYALNANSASYAETTPFALSASYANSASYAVSASHEIVKEISSSHADTADLSFAGIQPGTGGYIIDAINATRVASGSLFVGQLIPDANVFSAIGAFGQFFQVDGDSDLKKCIVGKGLDIADNNGSLVWSSSLGSAPALFNVLDGDTQFSNVTPAMNVFQQTTNTTPVLFDVSGEAGNVIPNRGVQISGGGGLEITSGDIGINAGDFYQVAGTNFFVTASNMIFSGSTFRVTADTNHFNNKFTLIANSYGIDSVGGVYGVTSGFSAHSTPTTGLPQHYFISYKGSNKLSSDPSVILTSPPNFNEAEAPNLNTFFNVIHDSDEATGGTATPLAYFYSPYAGPDYSMMISASFKVQTPSASFQGGEVKGLFETASYSKTRFVPHGNFYASASQPIITPDVSQSVIYDNFLDTFELEYTSGSGRIYIKHSGHYYIDISAQIESDAINKTMHMWPTVDGVQFNSGNRTVKLPSSNAQSILAVSYILQIDSGSYFELWMGADSTDMHLLGAAPGAYYPATPSVITNMQKMD